MRSRPGSFLPRCLIRLLSNCLANRYFSPYFMLRNSQFFKARLNKREPLSILSIYFWLLKMYQDDGECSKMKPGLWLRLQLTDDQMKRTTSWNSLYKFGDVHLEWMNRTSEQVLVFLSWLSLQIIKRPKRNFIKRTFSENKTEVRSSKGTPARTNWTNRPCPKINSRISGLHLFSYFQV